MPENDLTRLRSPTEYLSAAQHRVFPSQSSLDWFIRKHKPKLTAAGALVSINRRQLLDVPRFDAVVLEIGRSAVTEAA